MENWAKTFDSSNIHISFENFLSNIKEAINGSTYKIINTSTNTNTYSSNKTKKLKEWITIGLVTSI